MHERFLFVSGTGCIFAMPSETSFIYSGVVPQHPPATRTPIRIISSTLSVNSDTETSYTVLPSTLFGRPAFGFKITGTEAHFKRRSTTGRVWSGPNEQFTPIASARIPSRRATIASGEAPVISLPFSLYALETKTGRLPYSFAARSAAFVSRLSFMVSMKIKSTPHLQPISTVFPNAATASSNSKSPYGFSSFPHGPMSRAIYFSFCE